MGPTREAVVSWNTRELEGAIELRVNAGDGRTSAWLPYVRFEADARQSGSARDSFVRIDTDIVRADVDLVTIGVRSTGSLDALFVSTPDYGAPSPIVALPAVALDVPPYAQYDSKHPDERGWCAPTALAMLLAYRDYPLDVPVVAREVFDARYGGTGNWAFNVAFAGTLGFRAAVVHLRDLGHAHAFLADDIPLALSIAWRDGLPGAPLAHSQGHLVVLRGIDAQGDALVNDPAAPSVMMTYPRRAFQDAWLAHGGIALAVVPAPLESTLLRLANG
ncbi:MAG: C39 family peptidase [Candidatus Eremiobacteraeota bacterium]|nr:C39 family peptidase [Candidatus Eremiobacteraeota bacterium]MBC5803421.1 C39 family peptidase [Candidatus Eremiobacteraeota bacterium]MBC5821979.1 C39 family peptidase [Candidatus Eremiobacteraeota bacterium]